MSVSLISLMTLQRSSFCGGPASALGMLRTWRMCALALSLLLGAHPTAIFYLYCPIYKPVFGFPAFWQWKHLPEMFPIRELAATPKSGFWQKGILGGVLLLWNYNFMPLQFHSIILKFREFVKTNLDYLGLEGHSSFIIFQGYLSIILIWIHLFDTLLLNIFLTH